MRGAESRIYYPSTMASIAGIIGPHVADPSSANQIEVMIRLLQRSSAATHSGADRDSTLSAHVGWTRRDYEPDSFAWNARGDIGLVFIGDDFDLGNRPSALPKAGNDSRNPSQTLIELYEEFGPNFVTRLNGRFAGCLFDRRSETVLLFNDRYGLNRIYFHADSAGFFFSSEAKSLLSILPKLRRIDQRGLAEFFSVGCVLQNRSLFSDVYLLPPASRWTFHRDGTIRKQRYFDPSTWEQQEPLDTLDYTSQLSEVFSRILPKYLRGPLPAAMSLTGGLDSRMILAWAQAGANTLPCYTFGGPYRDCADVRIARRLAKICEQPHTTLQIGADFFDEFPRLAEKTVAVTDGAMDVSGAVELYVNQLARKISPIRVTGNYGSEILRSHVAFRPSRLDTSLFTPDFRSLLEEASATYKDEVAGNRLSFIAFKQVPWHHYARFAAEKSELTPRSPFLDNELVALAYRSPRELIGSATPLFQLISDGNALLAAVPTDRSLRARSIPVISAIENRWQEFTSKAEYAYDYGMPQWMAKTDRLLKPLHLEKLFLGRHKFYHFRIWYRDQLRQALCNGRLGALTQPSCYRDGAARRLVSEHTSGRFNRTLELHKLLTVQLMDRLLTSA
jgi:asparagine synthase (glutamine-hydrolysing)